MAIKIHKKEAEAPKVLEPEVLPPSGSDAKPAAASDNDVAGVKVPGLDDNFLRTSGTVMSWLMEHRRMVILVVTLIIVASFGYLGVLRTKESIATSKSSIMTDVFFTYNSVTKDEAAQIEAARLEYLKSQGIGAEASDILRYSNPVPNDQARYAAIEKYLNETLPDYKGEAIHSAGSLMLAGSTAKIHPADKAHPAYNEAAASTSQDVKLFAMLGQAEMLVGEQKYSEAIAKLDEIMAFEPGFSSYATYEKARIYEISGDKDKAVDAYKAVITKFNQKIDQDRAQARLRILIPDWANVRPTEQAAPQAPTAQAAI